MENEVLKQLRELILPEHIKTDEPMSVHTTFRVGGCADIFITPDEAELISVMKLLSEKDVPVTILGNGSNVLVSDDGIRGVVISLCEPISDITIEGDRITASAGALLGSLAVSAKNAGLSGLEFAGGIPGSVGGAVMMNAGAYGGEMADVISSVRYLDTDGNVTELTADELDMSYRHSVFMADEYKGGVILSATFTLVHGERDEIDAKMKEYNRRRREKQPLEYPSAGSTFKRPKGYFAGKLIQDAGLSGFSVGGACVSEKHCGFVINKGSASANDIYSLIKEVQKRIKADSGVDIEPEVRILGEF